MITPGHTRDEVPRVAGRQADLLCLLLILAFGALLPALSSVVLGAADIPRNDDWSYRRLAIELATTGRFALDGAAQTMIVGQLVASMPFVWISGSGTWGFVAAGITFAVVGILATYGLARIFVPPAQASLATIALLIFPGYLAYATSFMSDVPALAAEFGCLALGAFALRGHAVDLRWLTASIFVGAFALSIREFAVAAPVAVLAGAIFKQPRQRTVWLMALTFAVYGIALFLWRASLAGQLGDVAIREDASARLPQVFRSVALVMLPVIACVAVRRPAVWSRRGAFLGADVGLILTGIPLATWITGSDISPVVLENLLSPYGVPGFSYLIGGRPHVLPDAVWIGLNALALVATPSMCVVVGGVLGGAVRRTGLGPRAVARGLGGPHGILILFVLFTSAGLGLFGLRWWVFDRYFWPVVPTLAILLLSATVARDSAASVTLRRTAMSAGSAVLTGGAVAVVAVLLMLNAHAFDAARWRAGSALEASGVDPAEIDAGYEWMGYHSTTPAIAAQPADGLTWYRGWWPAFRECGIASSVPEDSSEYRPAGVVEWNLLGVLGPSETIYLYRSTGAECDD